MEEDLRSKKKGFFGPLKPNRGSRQEAVMYDRRPLKTYDLKPPDYHIKPQFLVDDYVEKPVLYAGVIDDVATDVDMTNRTDVLQIIDKGKKQGVIPSHVAFDQYAIFSVSVYHIKVNRYNSSEDLLVRIPMHEIAAACYIKDDGQHILAIKHGSVETCSLSVLYCDNKQGAEEICYLMQQCFQLLYTQATIQLLDGINDAGGGGGSISTSTGSSTVNHHPERPSFLSISTSDIPHSPHSSLPRPSPGRSRRLPSESAKDRGDRDSDYSQPAATELLNDYMTKLHRKLDHDELRHFASLLTKMHQDLPFDDFCEQILQLYGQERKHLLSEMSPFIPEENYPKFKDFLRKNDVQLPENGSTLSSSRSNPRIYGRRSVSELSTASTMSNMANGGDEVENMLEFVSAHIAKLDASVDVETNLNVDSLLPDRDYT